MFFRVKNNSPNVISLYDLGITIPSFTNRDLSSVTSVDLTNSLSLLKALTNGTLIGNNGERDLEETEVIKYLFGQSIEPRDTAGKMFMHPTPRPFGTKIHFTGIGDYSDVLSDIGTGEELEYHHKVGDDQIKIIYIDFNTLINKTYIQEGDLQWWNAFLDKITIEFVPRVVQTAPGTNTPYFYQASSPVILPSALAGGTGNITIVSNISSPTDGFVQALPNESGVKPPAFWNADFNSQTGLFENITPAIKGNGDYNLFHIEYPIARFVNRVGMLGTNTIAFNTSDTDPIPHGSRIRATFETRGEDHEWAAVATLVLDREKTC